MTMMMMMRLTDVDDDDDYHEVDSNVDGKNSMEQTCQSSVDHTPMLYTAVQQMLSRRCKIEYS